MSTVQILAGDWGRQMNTVLLQKRGAAQSAPARALGQDAGR
jgi:hypothetical protein